MWLISSSSVFLNSGPGRPLTLHIFMSPLSDTPLLGPELTQVCLIRKTHKMCSVGGVQDQGWETLL